VWNGERCLDWDATVRFADRLGVPVPRVLYRGPMDEGILRGLRVDPSRQEGFVVRTVDGFARAAYGRHVAKWVQPGLAQAHELPVVPNGLGRHAKLWDLRSGAPPDVPALLDLLGPLAPARTVVEPVIADVGERLDRLDRFGADRLAGVLAAILHDRPRTRLLQELPARGHMRLGMRVARRVGDLVGLHPRLHVRFRGGGRTRGLRRMARAVDLGVLHAVAAAVLEGAEGEAADDARENVAWSELHAMDAGLVGPSPIAKLRAGLRSSLAGLPEGVRDRCFAEALDAWVEGELESPDQALAYVHRFREARPRLVLAVGPAGSGRTRFAERLEGHVSVTEPSGADSLPRALDRLDDLLRAGRDAVWDANALDDNQRELPLAIARRRDATTVCAVLLVPPELLAARNAQHAHPAPEPVLAAQLERFTPPFPGDAHHTWYVDADGAVADREGTLAAEA
jgi:predicted kinase